MHGVLGSLQRPGLTLGNAALTRLGEESEHVVLLVRLIAHVGQDLMRRAHFHLAAGNRGRVELLKQPQVLDGHLVLLGAQRVVQNEEFLVRLQIVELGGAQIFKRFLLVYN